MSSSDFLNWPTEQPDYANLDAAVQGEIARWNAVGMAAGLVRDGERQISIGGWANYEARYPMVENSLFMIASISKIYAATLVLKLVEKGLLDLDTPVVHYVPDFKLSQDDVRDAITIRMLLSHTSGFDGDRFTDYGRGEDAYDKAVAEFHTLTQWFKPGSFYSYNNAGFYLIGHIVQKLTGKSYEDVMAEEIFKPMGLKDTLFMPEDIIGRAIAVGHVVDYRSGIRLSTAKHLPRHSNAAGGIMQSIGDLLTFAQMHLRLGEINGTRIISREHAQLMQQALIPADSHYRSYGIGWAIYERPKLKSVGHGGAWGGYKANLVLYPNHNIAHAALVNSDIGVSAYGPMEKWVARHHLNTVYPRPDRVELAPSELEGYVGTYLRHDGRQVVTLKGDNLLLSITEIDEDTGEESKDMHEYELEPLGNGYFRVCSPVGRDASVDFRTVPDANGNPRHLLRFSGRLAARASNVS